MCYYFSTLRVFPGIVDFITLRWQSKHITGTNLLFLLRLFTLFDVWSYFMRFSYTRWSKKAPDLTSYIRYQSHQHSKSGNNVTRKHISTQRCYFVWYLYKCTKFSYNIFRTILCMNVCKLRYVISQKWRYGAPILNQWRQKLTVVESQRDEEKLLNVLKHYYYARKTNV